MHVLLYLDILLLLIVFITDHGMSPYMHITFGNVVTYYLIKEIKASIDNATKESLIKYVYNEI